MLNNNRAFTLMEIILVVVIIGILAAIVMPRLVGETEKARTNVATTQIAIFKSAIARFESDYQRYPSTSEGLQALIDKPEGLPSDVEWSRYLDDRTLPLDPWNNAYVYRYPGTINTDGYDLFSVGPDGKEATDDDVGNTL